MFQMTRLLLADVDVRGDTHTYEITAEQLETARRKMRDGLGSIEWQRRHADDDDEPEILNVRSVDRIRPWREWDKRDALVQLAYRASTGECFIVDPDQPDHVFPVGPPAEPVGEFPAPPADTFDTEAPALVEGEFLQLTDFAVVPRPPADGDMTIIAGWTYAGGARLVDGVDPAALSAAARRYLGNLAPVPHRRGGTLEDDPGAHRGCNGTPCTLDHMHFFAAHTDPEGATE